MRRRLGVLLAALLAATGAIVAVPERAPAAPATASTVYYWNDLLLDLFRRQGGAPTTLSRAGAIMHAAVFDTINSAWWSKRDATGNGYHNYLTLWLVDPSVDDDLAAGLTAHDLLVDLFPAHRALIDQRFADRHGTGAPQAAARRLADLVVTGYRQNRANDGSTVNPGYTPDGVPGAWRPTGNPPCTATTPGWGNVRPFALNSGAQFRRPLPGGHTTYPALLASPLYAANLAQVRSLGRVDSTTRTAEQTTIAWFWANDLDGTYKPPGLLLDHTRSITQSRITDPVRLSRVFALVALSLADAAIAVWDTKYLTPIDLWRPVTAIQQDATNPDPTWLPLSSDRNNVSVTPCFPAWVSGHSAFAAAWGAVLKREVGDGISFTVGTEDPHLPPGVLRSFTSINQAVTEHGQARIYLGVHYQFDVDDGLATGNSVGTFVHTNKLTSLNCPTPCG
ncbi:vanadium-dependent haloperoxidase [Actinomycetes bacterium KLBMP 9797]